MLATDKEEAHSYTQGNFTPLIKLEYLLDLPSFHTVEHISQNANTFKIMNNRITTKLYLCSYFINQSLKTIELKSMTHKKCLHYGFSFLFSLLNFYVNYPTLASYF